jgi:hypothetical protein
MIHKGGNQRWTEFHAWASLCLGLGVKTYLELGCGSAGFMRLAGVKSMAIDILPDHHGGCIDHFHGNSNDPLNVERVTNLFDGPPDAVFIDADHEYGAVKLDFLLWYPIATKIVGFHDILMHGSKTFWDEIKVEYPSVEIIGQDRGSAEEWQHGSSHLNGKLECGGIGVIFKETL